MEKLLKPRDVKELLNLSLSATYTLLRSGAFPVIEPTAGSLRVRASDLEAYLKRRTVPARPGRPQKVYGPLLEQLPTHGEA